MSSHPYEEEDESNSGMDIDSEVPAQEYQSHTSTALVLRDTPNWLTVIRQLLETDTVVLLTPVVLPSSQESTPSDPFESLGRSIARRHPRIRQVPYIQRNGITSTHVAFIKRAQLIILCLVPREGSIPLNIADVLFAISDNKPCIIIVCSSMTDAQQAISFPTVIRCDGYTPVALESMATLLFDQALSETLQRIPAIIEDPNRSASSSQTPRVWPVEQWDEERDMPGILKIWGDCFRAPFVIDQGTLSSILHRPGYAKHYVVRNSNEGLLGFCATFLQFVDREGENLIASLAILIVHPRHRHQGIGLSLYTNSLTELRRTRGIIRLQLGSTFPRIFYGPPTNMNDEWLRRRGWHLDRQDVPGKGHIVYDLILNITDWRYVAPPELSHLIFRSCRQEDMQRVLQIVEYTSARQSRMCWYDQFWSLMNGPNVKDVVLALEDNEIVALALTYTPSCGSQVSMNLPWASIIGDDVGGITCVCVSPNKQETLTIALLDASIRILQAQVMQRVFLDAITDGVDHLKSLGFREWAMYKDVWKNI